MGETLMEIQSQNGLIDKWPLLKRTLAAGRDGVLVRFPMQGTSKKAWGGGGRFKTTERGWNFHFLKKVFCTTVPVALPQKWPHFHFKFIQKSPRQYLHFRYHPGQQSPILIGGMMKAGRANKENEHRLFWPHHNSGGGRGLRSWDVTCQKGL